MKLRRSDLHAIAHAIAALDQREQVVKDSDGKESIARIPYALNGKVRMNLARIRRIARADVEDFTETRNSIIKQHAPDGKLTAGTEAFRLADTEIAALLRAEVEVDLPRLAVADLAVDSNQLPPSVLDALLPLIDGDL